MEFRQASIAIQRVAHYLPGFIRSSPTLAYPLGAYNSAMDRSTWHVAEMAKRLSN